MSSMELKYTPSLRLKKMLQTRKLFLRTADNLSETETLLKRVIYS